MASLTTPGPPIQIPEREAIPIEARGDRRNVFVRVVGQSIELVVRADCQCRSALL